MICKAKGLCAFSFFFGGRYLGFTQYLYHVSKLWIQPASGPHSKELKKYEQVEKDRGKGNKIEHLIVAFIHVTSNKGITC